MNIPQLRIRTEYSMQAAFGSLDRVIARLKETGTAHGGMVDTGGGTWGHVQWQKEMTKAGLHPLFGAELIVRGEDDLRPTCWVLAEDPAALYRMTTAGFAEQYYGATTTPERMYEGRAGLLRFAGLALDDPQSFDYVDTTPASRRLQRRAADLAARTGRPLVLTSDNAYPCEADADAYKLFGRQVKPSPQHLLGDVDEWRSSFPALTDEEFFTAVCNTYEVGERLQGVKLREAPMIHFEGDLRKMCRDAIARRVPHWDEVYEARLERELRMIADKDFESYFLMVADLVQWAKKRMIVGPARGSSAGSIVCYLTEITEVDPIPYGLIFERFVDVTRKDLPDIDIDFPDSKRDLCYEYLAQKYGSDCVARIGTISSYKPKSALAQTCKALGIPKHETYGVSAAMFERSSGDARANNCLIDTLNETEPGRDFAAKYPAVKLAGEIEGHASHTGVHAAGVCVCNEPVTNFCTVKDGIMQIDKKDAELINLLKIDALGLRTLGVIEDANVMTSAQLYALPLDDPKVYQLFNDRKYAGIFQWEGNALQSVTNLLQISKFSELDQITALARPGPLGGGAAVKYIDRHEGREGWDYPHESMAEYLDESFGLVIYQEQVLRICRELGDMSWADVTLLRKAMSKTLGKEYFDQFRDKFMQGAKAKHGIEPATSEPMWDQINSMGSWAFNKSHSVSYGMISYWTAYLKVYFPLEYAAASLRNSQDEASAVGLLRELTKEGIEYVAFDIDRSQEHWAAVDGKLVGGFQNVVGMGPSKAAAAVRSREAGTLTEAKRAKILAAEVRFRDLYPLHAQYGEMYADPQAFGIADGTRLLDIADFPEEGEVVFLGRVIEKDKRDMNEAVSVAKRGGRRTSGPTEYAHIRVLDDSTSSMIILRVDRFDYEPIGRLAMDKLVEKKDVLLIRGRKLKGYPMVKMIRMKCLTNPGALE